MTDLDYAIKTFALGASVFGVFVWLMFYHPYVLVTILGIVLFIGISMLLGLTIRETWEDR